MVHCCSVPSCTNRSDRESHLSYLSLPLTRKPVLKQWIHRIGRKDLPIIPNTRVCSNHFVNATGRRLRPDEVPTLYMPVLSTSVSLLAPRNPPRNRTADYVAPFTFAEDTDPSELCMCVRRDASTQTENSIITTERELQALKQIDLLQQQVNEQKFRLCNIQGDDTKVSFYTSFQSYEALKAFYAYLGPSVDSLTYSKVESENQQEKNV